jgi:hypothetical protein
MLVNCGRRPSFPPTTTLHAQPEPLDRAAAPATRRRQQRWRTAGRRGRRAIATDFGFYAIMERRGYTASPVDRCLADEGDGPPLRDSRHGMGPPGVDSTPSFAINDIVMPGTHTWARSERQLRSSLRCT